MAVLTLAVKGVRVFGSTDSFCERRIGVGRFRILGGGGGGGGGAGGQGLEYWGGAKGGGKFPAST